MSVLALLLFGLLAGGRRGSGPVVLGGVRSGEGRLEPHLGPGLDTDNDNDKDIAIISIISSSSNKYHDALSSTTMVD